MKFKDADLIGIPLRVVIGERGLKEGKLEIKWRWSKQAEMIDLAGAARTLADLVIDERKENKRFRGRNWSDGNLLPLFFAAERLCVLLFLARRHFLPTILYPRRQYSRTVMVHATKLKLLRGKTKWR